MRSFGFYSIVIFSLLLLAGCSFKKQIYEEVSSCQELSFQQWRTEYYHQCHDDIVIDGKLSLENAITLSLRYNKNLQSIIEKKNEVKGKILEASSRLFPHLIANSSYMHMDEAPTLESNGKKIPIGHVNNYSVDLDVRQPLYEGGSILAGIRAANLYSWLTDEEIRKELQMTILLTMKSYLESLFAQKLYEVNEQTVLTARAHLEEVKNKQKEGMASSYDILRAEVEITNFEAEMIRQQNRVHVAKTQLLKILGVSQNSMIDLSDSLKYEPFEISFEEAVHSAFLNRPDLYVSQLVTRMQEQHVKIVRSEFLPKLSADFTQTWGRPDPHTSTIDTWGRKWNFRLDLRWPIFEGLRRYGKLKQEKSVLKQKEIAHENIKEMVIFDVQKALLTLNDAVQLVLSQEMDLQRASKALDLAKISYKEGVQSEIEVTDAISSMSKSQSLYYTAIFQHMLARLDLDYAMGILEKGKMP